jgi:PAS domain S-box-containing protein
MTEDPYRTLVDGIEDFAILALDPDGVIRTWNTGAERITGYSAADAVGQHFSMLYPDADRAADVPGQELRDAAKVERVEVQGWRMRQDGERFWTNSVIRAIRDAQGELIGYAKVSRDLTERRRSEEALRASEERFQLLVQGVRDYGIFMLDTSGYVASWNEGAARIKGYSADEIIGRHFSTFYPAEDQEWKPAWELEVAQRDGRFEDEGWRIRKDGTRFWANVIITPIYDSRKQLIGYGKVTRDLTERRNSEQQALEAARRAAEAEATSRAKSEFLATLSHELRTPLNAIGGYAELLSLEMKGPINPGQADYLDRIRRSQHHLLALINDLLNYSRIEAGAVDYDSEPVDIDDVLETVTTIVEPQAASKGLTLELEERGAPVTAMADRLKTEQIMVNLLSNATKFTPAGGTITVSCRMTETRAVIRVRDTGIGIPEERLQDVFEPFVQLERTLVTAHEGTGLGLAISRDLARAMGGDLTAVSEPGKGSTFTLELPRA